jgi:hypothetical protein
LVSSYDSNLTFLDDDYDLVVEPPNSDLISNMNIFDSISGGTFENDQNEGVQDQTFHTESVYFPLDSPPGEYRFFVEQFEQNGLGDAWKIEVMENGNIVDTENGCGASYAFSYFALECTSYVACKDDKICINDNCKSDGTPRFTLTWDGYDDLDLSVTTPEGLAINWQNAIDEASSGYFEDDFDYTGSKHAESVVFDGSIAPYGLYTINVEIYFQTGDLPDKWKLSVNVDGVEVKVWNQDGEASLTWNFSGANV